MGRDLSKTKPDVGSLRAKPWGMHRSVFVCVCVCVFCFFARVCVVRRGVEGSRSSLLWWVYAKSGWVVRSHTTPGGGSLHTVRLRGAGLVVVRVMWMCACVCVGGGHGGEIGQSAGGVIVLPDSQLEHRSSLSSSGPYSPRPPLPASQPVRLGRAWK